MFDLDATTPVQLQRRMAETAALLILVAVGTGHFRAWPRRHRLRASRGARCAIEELPRKLAQARFERR